MSESRYVLSAMKAEAYAKRMRRLNMPHRAVKYDELAEDLWAKVEGCQIAQDVRERETV